MRVIDDKGEQLGILSLRDALNASRERELDLVEVAPNADPPVCRILDYGKNHYTMVKRMREARKAQKITEIKEIRLRPKTDDYHTGFKVKRARDFLKQGMKVKVRVQFRGREITHPEIGLEHLREVAAELSDVATVEQKPDMEGRTMLMVLAPTPAVVAAAALAPKGLANVKAAAAAALLASGEAGLPDDDIDDDLDDDDIDDDDDDDDDDDEVEEDDAPSAEDEPAAVATDGAAADDTPPIPESPPVPEAVTVGDESESEG